MAVLRKLFGVECVRCRAAGHRCQAQISTEEGALCLRCADDEPCAYVSAAAAARAERLAAVVDPCEIPEVTRDDRKAIREMPRAHSIHATQGEGGRFNAISPEVRAEIIRDRKLGAVQLAAKYHVSRATIWNIRTEHRKLQKRLKTPVPARIGSEDVIIAPAAMFGAEMLKAREEEKEN